MASPSAATFAEQRERPVLGLSVHLVLLMRFVLLRHVARSGPSARTLLQRGFSDDGGHHYSPVVGDVLRPDRDTDDDHPLLTLSSGYVVRGLLGVGTFGVVVQCLDLRTRCHVAVKVISTRAEVAVQGQKELLTLQWLRCFADSAAGSARQPSGDEEGCADSASEKEFSGVTRHEKIHSDPVAEVLSNPKWARELAAGSSSVSRVLSNSVCHLSDWFYCRGRLCLVFPLLSVSLYDVLKQTRFSGLSLRFVHKVALQLVQVLYVLRYVLPYPLVHCDIKPENVLLRCANKSSVLLIDFGSSFVHCDSEKKGSYVQSRYYRAPEVILGMSYGPAADIWSLGAMLVELLLGDPLFPGRSEAHQLNLFVRLLGAVPASMSASSRRWDRFFEVASHDRSGAGDQYLLRPLANSSLLSPTPSLAPDSTIVAALATLPRHDVASALCTRFLQKQQPADQPINKKLRVEKQDHGAHAQRTSPAELRCFADFVAGMLRYDPRERSTARQLLYHPFLATRWPKPPQVTHTVNKAT